MAKKIILTVIFILAIGTLAFWYFESRNNDSDNSADVVLSATVYNQTQNADGTTVTGRPNDVLVYTLTASNVSEDVVSGYVVETGIGDISELANLVDASGGNFNAESTSLMWTPLDIPAKDSITKQFTVKVKDPIPAGTDMAIKMAYGNEISVNVAKATPAISPSTPPDQDYQAPVTGPSLWFAVILGLIFTVGLLLYRTARRMNA